MAYYDQKLVKSSACLKALGHPARLCIVNKLANSSNLTVGQMQECLGVSQSSISQHLAILKSSGIIAGERIGSTVIYSLVDTKIIDLVKIFLDS